MKKAEITKALREGQFVLRTVGDSPRYVNRQLACVDRKDYLSNYIGYAVVYSSMDIRADKVRFWSLILKQPVEAVDLEMVNGVAVGDTLMVEDLETGALLKTKVSFLDPEKQSVSVVVGKSMRIMLFNNKTNGRFYCPAMKADAQQGQHLNA